MTMFFGGGASGFSLICFSSCFLQSAGLGQEAMYRAFMSIFSRSPKVSVHLMWDSVKRSSASHASALI